jgi:hypothetical protein
MMQKDSSLLLAAKMFSEPGALGFEIPDNTDILADKPLFVAVSTATAEFIRERDIPLVI